MQRDWPDILGGLTLAAIGIGAAIWAGLHHDMGSLRRMGPGAFPVGLGLGLAGLGLIIALPALVRPAPGQCDGGQSDGGQSEKGTKIELAPLIGVVAAILLFGLSLRWVGLVGVSFVVVLVATLPAPRPGWLWRVVLAVAITALTVLVFHLGLRMTVPLWPRGW